MQLRGMYQQCEKGRSSITATRRNEKGGVCITHCAKVKVKRFSVEKCTNQVVNGGVCVTQLTNAKEAWFMKMMCVLTRRDGSGQITQSHVLTYYLVC